MPTSVRRRLAAASMVLVVPALGACGFNEQTDQVYQPGVGVNERTQTVDVLAAVVVSSTDGEGVFVASLVNGSQSKDDELTSISGDGVQATLAQPVKVPADQLVNLAKQGGVQVTGDRVKEGNWVRLTLEFGNGQQTELNVPIVAQAGEYESISPSASPSSSPSSSPPSPSSTTGPSSPASPSATSSP